MRVYVSAAATASTRQKKCVSWKKAEEEKEEKERQYNKMIAAGESKYKLKQTQADRQWMADRPWDCIRVASLRPEDCSRLKNGMQNDRVQLVVVVAVVIRRRQIVIAPERTRPVAATEECSAACTIR